MLSIPNKFTVQYNTMNIEHFRDILDIISVSAFEILYTTDIEYLLSQWHILILQKTNVNPQAHKLDDNLQPIANDNNIKN